MHVLCLRASIVLQKIIWVRPGTSSLNALSNGALSLNAPGMTLSSNDQWYSSRLCGSDWNGIYVFFAGWAPQWFSERFVTDYTYAKKRKRDLGEVCDRLLGVNTPTLKKRKRGKRESSQWIEVRYVQNKSKELLYKGLVEGAYHIFVGDNFTVDSWATGS